MITLSHWHFYVVISLILLYFNGVENFFFGVVFVIYTLIWGGIFWW